MRVIEFSHVQKSYGPLSVLKDLSFSVTAGEMVGLLGPNGAGKSTTLDLILGLKRHDQGEITILGQTPGSLEIKKKLGCLPQELAFPAHLKVKEVIAMVAMIYGLNSPRELIERFGVGEFAEQLCGGLSGGQKRRLGLVLAFMAEPELVILDEPTTGLDLHGKALMWDFLQEYQKKGGTALITSHDLYELTQLAQSLVLLDQGKVLFAGATADILGRCQYRKVIFCGERRPESPLIERHELQSGRHICWTRSADQLVTEMVRQEFSFSNLHIEHGSLVEVFQVLRGQE